MSQRKDSFFLASKSGNPTLKKFKKDDQYTKNLDSKQVSADEKVKKPFDKKTYRLKKYSNKYKIEKWEDQRKKKLLRNYYKEVKNDAPSGSYKPIKFDDENEQTSEEITPGKFVRHPDLVSKDESDSTKKPQVVPLNSKNVKKDAFWKAKEEFHRLKQNKGDKKMELERKKKEKEEKLREYQKKKAERFKKLNKKTKKGQPVMTGRLELLLEKIEQSK